MSRRTPRNRAQRDLDRPARERYATRSLTFEIGGDTCRGTLYLPSGTPDPPVVVMGPELGADRSFGLPAVAERFAAAGYAAFRFDYRGFGDSGGSDRRIAPVHHREDYDAAVDRVRRIDDLGPGVALYGSGLGALHALRAASDRRDVDAVLAITPLLDGRALLRRRAAKPFLAAMATGVRDATIGRLGGGRTVPIVGGEADRAVLTDPGAKRGYLDLVDRESTWRNETPARSLVSLARARLGDRIEDVHAPTLMLAGDRDALAPEPAVESAADRLPSSTYVRMPADHWSVYGADFEPAVGHQIAFLRDAFDA
ncbi:alpha/beta hydrolase [Halopenitus salinus]|uniref:Alpha/beta hydrolase n=3 Tax=Halopenitus salinus TaxID=1198295 RepID=A0ABD5V0R8_9EURY